MNTLHTLKFGTKYFDINLKQSRCDLTGRTLNLNEDLDLNLNSLVVGILVNSLTSVSLFPGVEKGWQPHKVIIGVKVRL